VHGSTAVVKFDKEAWVAKLTDEQKELLQLEIDTLHESWLAHLKDEVKTPEFLNLKRFLQKEIASGKKVFPPLEDVYSWFVPHSALTTRRASADINQGPDTHPSPPSRLSFSAKTHTTTTTKRMVSASPSVLQRQRPRL